MAACTVSKAAQHVITHTMGTQTDERCMLDTFFCDDALSVAALVAAATLRNIALQLSGADRGAAPMRCPLAAHSAGQAGGSTPHHTATRLGDSTWVPDAPTAQALVAPAAAAPPSDAMAQPGCEPRDEDEEGRRCDDEDGQQRRAGDEAAGQCVASLDEQPEEEEQEDGSVAGKGDLRGEHVGVGPSVDHKHGVEQDQAHED
eukprot:CAMPEP_0181204132 /NCGR_PEP_ID=MMETSP1096-20121128/19769_1 /TAXON_ID=156174 ORGANISM="Chrysochromulina ericina, Strain CCMP281" /NCGR_SAMPLE_ID=MMETSP1096 /ASSEMBLY_ACC=CAM_ASM_000453 /LENGTH=201 /DNA_ID=CAMNT_0023294805 /DNA_START=342 /DNA_END=949 /DNA_ORIENTATION=+